MRLFKFTAIFLTLIASSLVAADSDTALTVKSRVTAGGEITPAVAVLEPDESLHMLVQPATGFKLKQIHGCDGRYEDGLFIIDQARYSCIVNATFVLDPQAKLRPAVADANGVVGTDSALPAAATTSVTASSASAAAAASKKSNMRRMIVMAHQVVNMISVTAVVSAGIGTVTPALQKINKGKTASVTVKPATGYAVKSVNGCGLNSATGGVLTTPVLMASCTVNVAFVILAYGFWDSFNWDQALWS